MSKYCNCGLPLISVEELAENQCRYCSYKRKYSALIKYNDWRERRIWQRMIATFVTFGALLYWAFFGLK